MRHPIKAHVKLRKSKETVKVTGRPEFLIMNGVVLTQTTRVNTAAASYLSSDLHWLGNIDTIRHDHYVLYGLFHDMHFLGMKIYTSN